MCETTDSTLASWESFGSGSFRLYLNVQLEGYRKLLRFLKLVLVEESIQPAGERHKGEL